MPMEMKAVAEVRGIQPDTIAPWSDDEQFQLSGQAEVLAAQAAAPYQEIVRQGRSFMVNTTTAIAAVVAVPTTAHMLALYNGEADGGLSYVIDRCWYLNVANGAALASAGLIACLGQVRETAPTDAALTIKNLNGTGGRNTKARTILNATALPATTGLTANWFSIGQSVASVVASVPGMQTSFEPGGRYIVPPGRYFALHVFASHVGNTAVVGIEWTEKQLLLG